MIGGFKLKMERNIEKIYTKSQYVAFLDSDDYLDIYYVICSRYQYLYLRDKE